MFSSRESRYNRNGTLAFGIVLIASFVMIFSAQVITRPLPAVLVVVLGLIYFWIGTTGSRWVERQKSRPLRWGYFLVELLLGGVIMTIGKGYPGLLLLPIASQAIESLSLPLGILTCALIWGIQIFPILIDGHWDQIFSGGMAYLAAVVFVAVFTQLTVSEQKSRIELSEANKKLREYASKVEELATVQERNRLAREIHDGLGHYLTAINIQIKAAQAMIRQDVDQAATSLSNAQTLTQEALADVRRSITALRADPATNKPLSEMLNALVQESRAAGLKTDLKILGDPQPLSSQVEFTLYRVAQEGLTNIRKHARATQATIELDYRRCCDTVSYINLCILDNGLGSEGAETGGFGIIGLQERVEMMGGELRIETAPGQGYNLSVEIPV
jgi:signal transduction histidine kinase